jgi:hypothetical protein
MPSRQVFCKGGLQIQVIQDDKALQARRGPRRGPWSERRGSRGESVVLPATKVSRVSDGSPIPIPSLDY